jgi:hypothetical protein
MAVKSAERSATLTAVAKRQVIPNWRRALELLAGSADGCTEALLFAHGFTEATIAGLVDTGLVATLLDLSDAAVIPGEHIRQIEAKALRKLRAPEPAKDSLGAFGQLIGSIS